MALALLRPLETDGSDVVLEVDSGTNPLFRVLLGQEVRRDSEYLQLENPYWSSPWLRNENAGRHFRTSSVFRLDGVLVRPRSLVQLHTVKDRGRAAAWSHPLRLVAPLRVDDAVDGPGRASTMSTGYAVTPAAGTVLAPPRMIAVRSAHETFSRSASLEDLLGTLVQAALPVVRDLLSGASAPAAAAATATPGTGAAGTDQVAALIASLLRDVLGRLSSTGLSTGDMGGSAFAVPTSVDGNRFAESRAHPFVFGIDDALIATVVGPILSSIAGPLVKALPELMNAANGARLDSRKEDYRMISDLLEDFDRTQLLEQLIAAGAAGPASPPSGGTVAGGPDLSALLRLLMTASAPAATAPALAPPGPVTPAPLTPAPMAAPVRPASQGPEVTVTPAPSLAMLTQVTGPPVAWWGAQTVLFVRDRAVGLRFRLDTGPRGPRTPLPRAILDLFVREPGGHDLLNRTERITDLLPGVEHRVELTQAELSAVPPDTAVEIFAQLRWRVGSKIRQSTSVQPVVFGSGRHVTGTGELVGEPVELTDMARFRPFWNKLWSSPLPTDDRPLWGLDVAVRYSVVFSSRESGNGLMETRLSASPPEDGLRQTTAGRMKSGLEVVTAELNKLATLWPGQQPVDAEALTAFSSPAWLASQGGDAVHQVRFDGRRGTRGLLWAVPVPTVRAFDIARPQEVDAQGQVLSTTSEQVRFPVIESVRFLGLVTTESEDRTPQGASDGPTYEFSGYEVVHDVLVGLEPAAVAGGPS